VIEVTELLLFTGLVPSFSVHSVLTLHRSRCTVGSFRSEADARLAPAQLHDRGVAFHEAASCKSECMHYGSTRALISLTEPCFDRCGTSYPTPMRSLGILLTRICPWTRSRTSTSRTRFRLAISFDRATVRAKSGFAHFFLVLDVALLIFCIVSSDLHRAVQVRLLRGD